MAGAIYKSANRHQQSKSHAIAHSGHGAIPISTAVRKDLSAHAHHRRAHCRVSSRHEPPEYVADERQRRTAAKALTKADIDQDARYRALHQDVMRRQEATRLAVISFIVGDIFIRQYWAQVRHDETPRRPTLYRSSTGAYFKSDAFMPNNIEYERHMWRNWHNTGHHHAAYWLCSIPMHYQKYYILK